MSKQHILIIGIVWPEPLSSAAGARMLQLIEQFQQAEWKITFASAAVKSEYAASLPGIYLAEIELNSSSFDAWIKELQPTLVLFDRFITEEQFGWRVAEACPGAMRIIDTEDLHGLRAARQQAFKAGRIFSEDDLFNDTAKREIAAIQRSDLSLIISTYEMELLYRIFKVDASLLHYVPFMVGAIDTSAVQGGLSFSQRKHFVSIGNFLHEPNWNAVLYMKEEIWPLIRKQLPDAELHVYGAYTPSKAENLHNAKEGFIIKGRAEDAMEVMGSARVCLATLRFGAGLKGKLLEAMLCGTPSVTTGVGAEGMHESLLWNGYIADGTDEIAKAAIDLYTNEEHWKTAQANGIRIVNGSFQKEKYGPALIKKIEELQANLLQHRKNNFTGAMLMHHTLNSTKFMSKWIEEKNGKKQE